MQNFLSQTTESQKYNQSINQYAAEQEPDGRVTVRRNPNAGKIIVVDAILEELSAAVLMNIDTSSQAVMDVTLDYRWIGSRLHLKPSYPIVVDVVVVKVTLQQNNNVNKY